MTFDATSDASGSELPLSGASTLLAHTLQGECVSLEVNGIPMRSLHAELTAILRTRLGAQHAAYLARPVPSEGSSIRWLTNLPPPMTAVHALSDDLGASVRRRAAQIEADIQALAGRLSGEGAEAARFGAALRLVSRRPPGDWLFVAGGHPVVACWGHEGAVSQGLGPNAPAHTPGASTRLSGSTSIPAAKVSDMTSGAARPVPGSSSNAGVPSRSRGRGWMLAGALSLAVLIAGAWAIGTVSAQRAAMAEQIRAGEAQLASLQADSRQLAAELARRRASLQCPAPSTPGGK